MRDSVFIDLLPTRYTTNLLYNKIAYANARAFTQTLFQTVIRGGTGR